MAHSRDQVSPIQQMSVTNELLQQMATPFRFLDLPLEIRLEIYSYFAKGVRFREWQKAEAQLADARRNIRHWEQIEVPAADVRWESFRAEIRAIRTTRRALTLVCQQVSNEFIPVLYRNSTIIVHASQSPVLHPYYTIGGEIRANIVREPDTDLRKLTGPKKIIPRGTASIFEQDFLNTISFSKLSSIRHLSYDVSIWNLYLLHPGKFDFQPRLDRNNLEHASTTNIDFSGLGDFPTILARCRDRLPSLEQVTVCSEGDGDLPRYRLTREQARQPDVVWCVVNDDGNWEQLERTLTQSTSEQNSAALRGWRVTREIHVVSKGWPPMRVRRLQNLRYIKKVTIDFRRPQVGTAENSQQDVTPELLVHGDLD